MRRPGGTATVMNVANDGRGCTFRIYVHAADCVPFEDLVASTVPRNGVVLLANNSQIIYTPRPGFRGEDQFVVSSVPRGTLIVRVIVKPPLPDQPG